MNPINGEPVSSDGGGEGDLGKAAANKFRKVQLFVFREVKVSASPACKPSKQIYSTNSTLTAPERNMFVGPESIERFLSSDAKSMVDVLSHQPVPLAMVHELLAVLHQLPHSERFKSCSLKPKNIAMPVRRLLS